MVIFSESHVWLPEGPPPPAVPVVGAASAPSARAEEDFFAEAESTRFSSFFGGVSIRMLY